MSNKTDNAHTSNFKGFGQSLSTDILMSKVYEHTGYVLILK